MNKISRLCLVGFFLLSGCGMAEKNSDSGDPEALKFKRPSKKPTVSYSTTFTGNDGMWAVDSLMSGGSVQFGVASPDASDQKVALLTFPGDASNNAADYVSPGYAEQIRTSKSLGYGHYRVVAKPSSCAATSENVIYGLFTYWNNGSDLNQNGMIDNSEIDFEISCAEPGVIYMTVWTDYTDDTHFSKVTRRLDLTSGYYSETSPGEEKNSWDLNGEGHLLDASGHVVALPDFTAMDEWLDLDMTWSVKSVKFGLTLQGIRYPLWTYANASHIPSHAAPYMMNVWHSQYNWDSGALTDYPSQDQTLALDAFSYSP